eukprot:CAMPEP_0115332880 /NCGR_PEP_ID=MMETSP0270-20121206/87076_1 /TAXON_ID=71861 /ORGANISM="Scrippsiella trochoidea, Strain CCMP3099" /LENGTH=215 /DNA_ID=CAMNT_0002753751 /DNA_START=318 /DNA_END=962 /DNA_ORIENTATION=-
MLTLLQATTSGLDWRDAYAVLVEVGSYLPAVFVFYILFFVIAAWNIVTSTFVDKALRFAQPDLEQLTREQLMKDIVDAVLAQPDLEQLTREQLTKDIGDAEELMNLFSEADFDRSASISLEEFIRVAEHPKFRSYLHVRGIDIKNAEVFFEMLQVVGGGEVVNIQVLVSALLRMKGFATSIDLHSLSFETKVLSRRQQIFMHETNTKLQAIKELM